ncbi:MAG: hypothetical protein NDI61_07675 [Bdellovibrionaceae bacterium]|nr:hypothetical protein [Pseudobdellovibrionaceae bacterium]
MTKERIQPEVLQEIQYEIWRGDLYGHETHLFWKDRWGKLLRGLGTLRPLDDGEFLMQDKVTTLTYRGEIVGMHLIKEYSRRDFRTHPYFKGYNSDFFAELERRGAWRVQALQYFIVDDAWSVAKTLVNFGAIIASLSLRHQIERHLNASITIARADIPVTSLGKKIGFEELSSSVMHNVDVGLIACFEPKPYPKDGVNEWVDYYWSKRAEYVVDSMTKVRAA